MSFGDKSRVQNSGTQNMHGCKVHIQRTMTIFLLNSIFSLSLKEACIYLSIQPAWQAWRKGNLMTSWVANSGLRLLKHHWIQGHEGIAMALKCFEQNYMKTRKHKKSNRLFSGGKLCGDIFWDLLECEKWQVEGERSKLV